MKNYLRAILLSLIVAAFTQGAYAAWGDYDTTFGFLGAAFDSVTGYYPAAVAVQADGKILVTGYRLVGGKDRFFLRRYLSNGQVDTSFGNNGSAISNAFIAVDGNYRGEKIVVQANGRIAVLGVGNTLPTVWRFQSSGSGDSSIGNGGMRSLPGYHPSFEPDIATYANILYVGLVKDDFSSGAVIKFNSSGSRDMAFGTAGELLPSSDLYYSLGTEAGTGNILIGGKKDTSPYGIERFLPTGQLDPTFNHYDTTYQGAPGVGYPSSFIQLANGQFVLNEAWYPVTSFPPNTTGANLVRFASDGNYLGRKEYVTPVAGPNIIGGHCPSILDQQSDGRVIAKSIDSNKLYRFSTSFATVLTLNCSNYASIETRTRAVLQADDKMIAAGRYNGSIVIVQTLP